MLNYKFEVNIFEIPYFLVMDLHHLLKVEEAYLGCQIVTPHARVIVHLLLLSWGWRQISRA